MVKLDRPIKVAAGVCISHPQPATISALMQLAYEHAIHSWLLGGISLLPFVRNEVVKRISEQDPEFTHLLFIDDDMENFNAEQVKMLVDADKPIISGVITMRMPPYHLVSCLNTKSKDEIMQHLKNEDILEEAHVGMAFTLVKREVLDAMRQPLDIWFTMDRRPREAFKEETATFLENLVNSNKPEMRRLVEAIQWGQTSFLGSKLIGEDVEFCQRAAAFGFKSYTHCGVIVGHIGARPHTVRDHLVERELACC